MGRSERWVGRGSWAGACGWASAAVFVTSCVISPIDDGEYFCAVEAPCAEGFRCDDGRCVRGRGSDAGALPADQDASLVDVEVRDAGGAQLDAALDDAPTDATAADAPLTSDATTEDASAPVDAFVPIDAYAPVDAFVPPPCDYAMTQSTHHRGRIPIVVDNVAALALARPVGNFVVVTASRPATSLAVTSDLGTTYRRLSTTTLASGEELAMYLGPRERPASVTVAAVAPESGIAPLVYSHMIALDGGAGCDLSTSTPGVARGGGQGTMPMLPEVPTQQAHPLVVSVFVAPLTGFRTPSIPAASSDWADDDYGRLGMFVDPTPMSGTATFSVRLLLARGWGAMALVF